MRGGLRACRTGARDYYPLPPKKEGCVGTQVGVWRTGARYRHMSLAPVRQLCAAASLAGPFGGSGTNLIRLRVPRRSRRSAASYSAA